MKNLQVAVFAVLWAILLYMLLGCAHRPPILKEYGDCIQAKVPAGKVFFCLNIGGDAYDKTTGTKN